MKYLLGCGLTALVGCGSSASVCKIANCPQGTSSYQSCGQSSDHVTYAFGASTCECRAGDTVGCTRCTQEIADYCSGAIGSNGNGGAGGSADCVPRSGATTDQYVLDTFTLPQHASEL